MFRIQTVIIEVTEACPNNCIDCFVPHAPRNLDFNDFKKIYNKLPKFKTLTYSGGEPLLHPYLIDMIKYARMGKKQEFIGILTAGQLISLKPFKDLVDMFFITIKYPHRQFDNDWKQNNEAFLRATFTLEQCIKHEIPCSINWCIDNQNKKYFEQMITFAEQYHTSLNIIRFIPFSRKDLFLSDKDWNRICKQAHLRKIDIAFPNKYDSVCPAGINRIGIRFSGTVKPCLYHSKVIGNLLKEDWNVINKKLEDWRWKNRKVKGCIVLGEIKS